MKTVIATTLLVLVLVNDYCHGFSVCTSSSNSLLSRSSTATPSPSSLFGSLEDDSNVSRRGAVEKAAVAAVTVTAAAGLPRVASAEEQEGRLIEFQVANLDGEEGKTGKIVIRTKPSWAPKGVARFEELTTQSFWDGARIFRVLPNFVAQFGITGDPGVQATWRNRPLSDDPVKVSNDRGTVVFATAGPGTRTTQIFINTNKGGNGFLDKQGFSPIGEVVEGMDLVDRFYAGYGEGAPSGKGPNQGLLQSKGNAYVVPAFPKLTYFSKASFVN